MSPLSIFSRKKVADPPLAANTGKVLTISEELRPVLFLMRFINILPLGFSDGNATFSWWSGAMAFSIVFFVAGGALSALVFFLRLEMFLSSVGNFSEAVFMWLFLFLLHPYFITPFVYWRDARSVAEYLQDWTTFQEKFHRLTGTPLRLNVTAHAWKVTRAGLLVPTVLAIVLTLGIDHVYFAHVPPFFGVAVFHAVIPGFWGLLADTVENASNTLTDCFEKVADVLDARVLGAYRELWQDLHSLTERSARSWGGSTLHYLVLSITCVLVPGFGVLTGVLESGFDLSTTGLIMTAADSLYHCLAICSAAHRAAHAVGTSMKRRLLGVRLDGRLGGADPLALAELRSFLQSAERYPKLTLLDFVSLRLSLVSSIVQTLTTYLCVLLQFAVALQY